MAASQPVAGHVHILTVLLARIMHVVPVPRTTCTRQQAPDA